MVPQRPQHQEPGDLHLGSRLVELLLPHRRPFLMVDRIESFRMRPQPTVRASRHITMNETVFQGHFPGLPIWPGVLTLEGLQQCAVLTVSLAAFHRSAAEKGEDPENLFEALRNLDRGFRLHPAYRADGAADLIARLAAPADSLVFGAAVQIKFLRPVFPGCRLDYSAEMTHEVGAQARFSVAATVEGEPVAEGTIAGAISGHPPVPRAP